MFTRIKLTFLNGILVAASLVIFAADAVIPLGIAAGVAYVLLVAVTLYDEHTLVTRVMTAAGATLVILGFFLSPGVVTASIWTAVINRALSLVAIIVTGWLIVQRKTLTRKLSEERSRLDMTMRSIGDGLIVTDREGRIAMMNPVAEQLSGWSLHDARDRQLNDLFQVCDERTGELLVDPIRRVVEDNRVVAFQIKSRANVTGFRDRVFTDSAAPIRAGDGHDVEGVVIIFHDITSKRHWEQDLRKKQKLDAMAMFAGGIAHDFNTCLNDIGSNLSLVRKLSSGGMHQEIEAPVRRAQSALARAAERTSELLDIAHGGEPAKISTDLAQLVTDCCGFRLFNASAACSMTIPEDLWPVMADGSQIARVVHNVIENGLEAMADRSPRFEVSGRNMYIADKDPVPLADGAYVCIAIRDCGDGISAEELGKVFEPFYTTKSGRRGLGLAVSYRILRNHNGYLDIQSSPETGTAVSLYLPALLDVDEASTANVPLVPVDGRGKRIVLMSGDAIFASIILSLLHTFGFEVVVDDKAIADIAEMCRSTGPGSPDLFAAIFDIGDQLSDDNSECGKANALKAAAPGLPRIAVTGNPRHPAARHPYRYGFYAVLTKPVSVLDLTNILFTIQAKREDRDRTSETSAAPPGNAPVQ